jgi:hypothetical protein
LAERSAGSATFTGRSFRAARGGPAARGRPTRPRPSPRPAAPARRPRPRPRSGARAAGSRGCGFLWAGRVGLPDWPGAQRVGRAGAEDAASLLPGCFGRPAAHRVAPTVLARARPLRCDALRLCRPTPKRCVDARPTLRSNHRLEHY